MAQEDLMIGDFVYVARGYDKHLTIEKVKGIIADKDEPYPVTISTGETVSLNDIKPIPITEDILEKNGFEYAYKVSEMHNKQLLVANIGGHYIEVRLDKKNVAIWYDYDENESGFYSDVFLDLPKTVHQLQHLLRLCGVEKSIIL